MASLTDTIYLTFRYKLSKFLLWEELFCNVFQGSSDRGGGCCNSTNFDLTQSVTPGGGMLSKLRRTYCLIVFNVFLGGMPRWTGAGLASEENQHVKSHSHTRLGSHTSLCTRVLEKQCVCAFDRLISSEATSNLKPGKNLRYFFFWERCVDAKFTSTVL